MNNINEFTIKIINSKLDNEGSLIALEDRSKKNIFAYYLKYEYKDVEFHKTITKMPEEKENLIEGVIQEILIIRQYFELINKRSFGKEHMRFIVENLNSKLVNEDKFFSKIPFEKHFIKELPNYIENMLLNKNIKSDLHSIYLACIIQYNKYIKAKAKEKENA